MAFFDEMRQAVAEGQIDTALVALANYLKHSDRELYNEVLLHTYQAAEIRRRERRRVETADQIAAARNALAAALIDLMDDAETRLSTAPRPVTGGTIDPIPAASTLEKIFGRSHLRGIAWLEHGLSVARSVCRIVLPTKGVLGSGFVVRDSYVVSNHHVLESAADAADAFVDFGYEEDFRGNLRVFARQRLNATTYRASAAYDVAICKLADGVDAPPPLELSSKVPAVEDEVIIIQHPEGGPKQIAVSGNQVVSIYEHRLQYMTDTLPGSSGSPVFNLAWEVVAVHHAGGHLPTGASGSARYVNEGVLARHVLDLLG